MPLFTVVEHPLETAVILLALLLAGVFPAPAARAAGPDDRFRFECRFSEPELFAGENASAEINLTNQQADAVAVQAIGIQFDWMKPYEHWYDENITGPVNITGGESLYFHMQFPIPADAAPIDHIYHVCVEYFANRSGQWRLYTFCSENQSDFRVTDFDLSVTPVRRDITIGEKAVFVVGIRAKNNLTRKVDLDESGPGAFEHPTVLSEISPTSADAQNGSTLVMTTTNASGLGQYSARVRASIREIHRYATVAFSVLGRPYFTVDVRPQSASVVAGRTATFKVAIRSFNNFTGNVTLSWLERPHGSTITFWPCVIAGNGTSDMAVRTAGDGKVGDSLPVSFEAASPGLVLKATARLSIRAPPTEMAAPDLLWLALVVGIVAAAAYGVIKKRGNAGKNGRSRAIRDERAEGRGQRTWDSEPPKVSWDDDLR
jgi:hypothetical protein